MPIGHSTDTVHVRAKSVLTLPARGGGGGGGGSARTDFNFGELPWYLSNTYKIMPLLLKFVGEQDSGKFFLSRVSLVAMETQFS